MKRSFFIVFALSALGACTSTNEPVGNIEAALTDEQCTFFEENGKVTICHATGSATNPFVVLKTSEAGCINGHADHADDQIAIDGKCEGGCLPEDAPVGDREYACCKGLDEVEGLCSAPVVLQSCDQRLQELADTAKAECVAKYGDKVDCGKLAEAVKSAEAKSCRQTCELLGGDIKACEDSYFSCAVASQTAADGTYNTCLAAGKTDEECLRQANERFDYIYEGSGCPSSCLAACAPGTADTELCLKSCEAAGWAAPSIKKQ